MSFGGLAILLGWIRCLGIIHICVWKAILANICVASNWMISFVWSLVCSFEQILLLQDANGLGLQAVAGDDYCRVVIRYPSDTVSKWVSSHVLCYFFPYAAISYLDCFIWFCTYVASSTCIWKFTTWTSVNYSLCQLTLVARPVCLVSVMVFYFS